MVKVDLDSPREQVLHVPKDFVIYKCKLSGGRLIDVLLPLRLTRADADRICALVQTQIDDVEP